MFFSWIKKHGFDGELNPGHFATTELLRSLKKFYVFLNQIRLRVLWWQHLKLWPPSLNWESRNLSEHENLTIHFTYSNCIHLDYFLHYRFLTIFFSDPVSRVLPSRRKRGHQRRNEEPHGLTGVPLPQHGNCAQEPCQWLHFCASISLINQISGLFGNDGLFLMMLYWPGFPYRYTF